MTLKATQIFLFILVTSLTSSAQNNDYKIYRDSLTKLSCKPFDSLTVANTVNKLNQLDTNQFHKNLDLFGWAYYRLFSHNKDTSFIIEIRDQL